MRHRLSLLAVLSVLSLSAIATADDDATQSASVVGKDGYPLAGWHNGLFFLRDADDNFRLYLQARAQIDAYVDVGPGVSDLATLKPTMFLRRIRPELSGEILHRWSYMIAGDFGATGVDNGTGRSTETIAAAPGKTPDATTARYASAQTTKLSAAPSDVFVNYAAHPLFNVQVGQYDQPFMLEGRTSDKYIPFMERSLPVRATGNPNNKEIGVMFWGEMPSRFASYAIGVFDGDGQNRPNTDGDVDVMGRAFAHPLIGSGLPIDEAQIGASVRYGKRDHRYTNYDYPAFSTQGQYTFWSPVYAGAAGVTHVIPASAQTSVAGELRVPVSIVDLTGEVVYIDNGTREAIDGYQGTNTERFGALKGYSYYAQVGVWALGSRDVNGVPGYENPPHVDFKKPDPKVPATALQLLVKWEQLAVKYASASRAGVADAKNVDGDIKVNAVSLGANYWATKHLRLSVNYVANLFPGSEPTSPTTKGGTLVQTSSQRALAPGNTLPVGVNDAARDGAHVLHELLFRVGVAL